MQHLAPPKNAIMVEEMQAVVLERFGEAKQVLKVKSWPKPMPGPNQVRVQTEGFGLNFADVMARKGMYPPTPKPPSVLGYDCVGTVDQVGEGVPEEWIGQRVLAFTRFGGYATYAVSHLSGVVKLDSAIPAAEAVALATQYTTAYYMAEHKLSLKKGDKVLIHAASGGVGTALIQLCQRRGCDVIALAGSEAKCAQLKIDGVHQAINYRQFDYAEVLKNVKLVASFNAVGGKSFKKDVRLLEADGTIALFGAASRTTGLKGIFGTLGLLWRMGVVLPIMFMGKSHTLLGVNMLAIADQKPELLNECMQAVVKLYQEGVLKPKVGGNYSASDIAEAHQALEGRKTTGKVYISW